MDGRAKPGHERVGNGSIRAETALALVNDVTSPLAAGADIVIDQHAGEEHSTAATRSVVCSLLAIDLPAEALSGQGPSR
jgi:glucosamine--fructose-6-phosphate aminotransferase (isomerizing)